jgi:hypothetical protein
VVYGLLGVYSPPYPDVALRRAEKTKIDKYPEWVRSRHDVRFIFFAIITDFCARKGNEQKSRWTRHCFFDGVGLAGSRL